MSFKYDITEFCTSIKPACFRYIFSQYNAGGCIYLDPDTFLFGSLEGVYSDLLRYSIILTPHINFIEPRYSGALDEKNLLYSGMYNLGFLALRNDDISDVLLNWWEVRLMDKCFQSMSENLFTDQKWMDFLPSFFPSQLFVSPDLGLNLAPWNFHEREVLSIDNTLHIKNRLHSFSRKSYPLVFVHFSGFNYRDLAKGIVSHAALKDLHISDDLVCLFSRYAFALTQANFSIYLGLRYSYNFFSDGVRISAFHRRLFRKLLETDPMLDHPFSKTGTFYALLNKAGFLSSGIFEAEKLAVSSSNKFLWLFDLSKVFLKTIFFFIGPVRFFMLMRLFRYYSAPENHLYLLQ